MILLIIDVFPLKMSAVIETLIKDQSYIYCCSMGIFIF